MRCEKRGRLEEKEKKTETKECVSSLDIHAHGLENVKKEAREPQGGQDLNGNCRVHPLSCGRSKVFVKNIADPPLGGSLRVA